MLEQSESQGRLLRVVCLLWRIWKSRNLATFEETQMTFTALHQQFQMQVAEWEARGTVGGGGGSPGQDSPVEMLQSSEEASDVNLGMVCSVDAAVCRGSHAAGGMVLRDLSGADDLAKGRLFADVDDPGMPELLALREAL
ncbi:unnamed protein product [Linum trigynum]|uniref:Uncharacterized protein n=1 Tax=Linum trigynum TaxID=586398 RepID=A0AAV2DW20_9ROSI